MAVDWAAAADAVAWFAVDWAVLADDWAPSAVLWAFDAEVAAFPAAVLAKFWAFDWAVEAAFEPLVTELAAAVLAKFWAFVWAADAAAEPLNIELFTPLCSELVSEFNADIESAVAPPVILIEPCMFRLLPSHVRNPSDAPPFKLNFLSPPSYPIKIPLLAAYWVIPPIAIYGSWPVPAFELSAFNAMTGWPEPLEPMFTVLFA